MSNLNVLVVGASIAGPTSAYWLAKAGARVTVIERFPQLRGNGQNVDIRTTGVTVMRKMPGMEAAVKAKLYPIEGFSFVGDDGRSFATMKQSGDVDRQSLISEFEIFRGDLSNIIYDMTKDNERIKYIFGEQVASIQQKDDGPVTVEFQNGTPTSQYDLVVACDGATSRTRAIGLGCGVRDHIHSLNWWAAFCTIDQDILKGSKVGQSYCAPGGRFIGVGPAPEGLNKACLMGMHPRGDPNATLPFRQAAKQGDDALKQYVAKWYAGVGWKTDELIKGMMESTDFYASEFVQVKVPSLHKGRFVLVGDAGYCPTNGAGTSLAMGGAYVLAGEICRHKDDLESGLKAYEERMRPIIDDMQKLPPGMPGVLAPQTAWGVQVRNIFLIIICWAMQFGSLFSWVGGLFAASFGGDKYNLPDYEWVN